ncbi:MAG: hypothetical protein K2W95_34025 [Candidatus Obscuribacterales bacterium]|nr:hypothetical protein [Candidatus Obscuribacterales bacterium]
MIEQRPALEARTNIGIDAIVQSRKSLSTEFPQSSFVQHVRPTDQNTKLPPFEIAGQGNREVDAPQGLAKNLAAELQSGTFTRNTREELLKALNSGDTEQTRRRSLNDLINLINRELQDKGSATNDPNKQYQIRTLDLRDRQGNRSGIRIGLMNSRSPNPIDSFEVQLAK